MIYAKESKPLLVQEDAESVPVVSFLYPSSNKMIRDNSRSEGLHKGAAIVMSKWPDYATTCIWIGVLSGVGLLLLAASGVILAYEGAYMPSCIAEYRISDNTPLHTCVFGNIPEDQINLLIQAHPNRTIRIISFTSNKNTSNLHNLTNNNKSHDNHLVNLTENVTAIPNEGDVEILHIHPSIYFHKSILNNVWRKLDKSGLLLSCRALAVWNYGGTAFDINYYINEVLPDCTGSKNEDIEYKKKNNANTPMTGTSVSCELTKIRVPEAQEDNVVLLARDGALISSKKPCHAFTWHILFAARVGARNAEDMAISALETFCRGRKLNECSGIQVF